ncbi:hypothetical protein BDFB_003761 [Asbolus verrucosus]|uniref:Uncharacterized protein n=1 Tax=Asbolus verrucosus TaxID=1661398 RepID=A0A482VL60_ASBVE|nr:hypothetical protein BDFB_003761 [Asbolus verrucosus]
MSIASASTTVKFHEFPSGTIIHNYQPGTQVDGPIRSISWSKDGNWLALVPHSGLAEIVSVKDQLKLIHTIQGIEEPSCASFQNMTKRNIAVGTKSGQVLIYDIKARNVKKRFPRTTSAVTRVEFTAQDNHVVAACESGEAYLYSYATNNLSGTFKIPRSQTISALRTNSIKRNYVVAGSNEGVVAVWDIHGNKNKFFIGSHKAPVTAVAFSPVSSDLVVSTGLDRQFCFYDIGGNKCIGNIFVENSMTSVDFSPDGKFIVMASQKGKIYVYDSKNIQQPIHSFFGHTGTVEHLSFRKTEDYETSFNMSSENVKESNTTIDSQRNNDSFGLYMMPVSERGNNEPSQCSTDAVDSFMAAVGLDQNNTGESNKQDFSFKTSEGNKKFLMHKYTPTNPSKILQEKFHNESKTHLTSTPNYVNQEMCPPISPIVNLDPQSCPSHDKNLENLQELVRDTVKEELKIASEELKNDMKYYSTHNVAQTRQMCLDLLMSMVKEFIKVENNFNNLRADLVCDLPQNQGALFEENLMLKQKIAVLEEELSVLKNNEINKNNIS